MVGKLMDNLRVFYDFVEVGKNKQAPSYATGAGKGQDNGRGHCFVSAAKLPAIMHHACWGDVFSRKKDCRVGIGSPFSRIFKTLSGSDPADSALYFDGTMKPRSNL
jgi:hypothetical protein